MNFTTLIILIFTAILAIGSVSKGLMWLVRRSVWHGDDKTISPVVKSLLVLNKQITLMKGENLIPLIKGEIVQV